MTERERNEVDAQWYFDRYNVKSWSLGACDRPIKLRDHAEGEPRVCRFCGRTQPAVTYGKEAHAAPDHLGNRCLISLNECDEFFGSTIEDQFSKASGPLRTLSQVPGKRGVPTFKADKSIRVQVDEKVVIDVHDQSTITDDGNSQLNLGLTTQPFVPLAAAKCLVKIACSLADKQDLPVLAHTIRWLRLPTTADAPMQVQGMPVLLGFVPGVSPYGGGTVHLLTRKNDVHGVPYMWVVVAFGNCQLQTLVPFCSADGVDIGSMNFECRYFPLVPANDDLQLGANVRAKMNWSATNRIRAAVNVGMHYELKVEMQPADPGS